MLPFPGARGTSTVEPPPLDPSYGGQHFAALVRRADDPLRAGDTIALPGMTVQVREVSASAGPTTTKVGAPRRAAVEATSGIQRQLHVVCEAHRNIGVPRVTDACQVLRAVIGVVREDERAARE